MDFIIDYYYNAVWSHPNTLPSCRRNVYVVRVVGSLGIWHAPVTGPRTECGSLGNFIEYPNGAGRIPDIHGRVMKSAAIPYKRVRIQGVNIFT